MGTYGDRRGFFLEDCKQFKEDTGMSGHLKWTKVSTQKLEEYKYFIDIFFKYNRVGAIEFKCIVIDMRKVDYKKYSGGNSELGFYKFYYQLLSKNIKPPNRYLILMDRRQNRQRDRLKVLKIVLNNYAKREFGRDLIGNIEVRSSKDVNQIQMVDILIGSIGYHLEGYHHRVGSKVGKVKLAEYIAQNLYKRDLTFRSRPYETKFNIWHFKLT